MGKRRTTLVEKMNSVNFGFLETAFDRPRIESRTLGARVIVGCCQPPRRISRDGEIMETVYSATISSLIGPLFLAASDEGLIALEFDARLPGQQSIRPNPRHLREEKTRVTLVESLEVMRPYVDELNQYFAGQRRSFTFPLDLRGTGFQLDCWRALQQIPYGETRSYADIARTVGKPNAFRAVGMANNRNPVAIVVPCHRVIASDGTLCGYGGGLEVKRKLLELEGALTGSLAA